MAATRALRVVSYNVQRWTRLDAVIDTLARLRPDVLCLQECCQKRGPGALQKVADACGLKQVHFFGHTMDESYGNAILTRAPSSVMICVESSIRRPTPSSRCCLRSCVCSMAWKLLLDYHTGSDGDLFGGRLDHRGPPHPARCGADIIRARRRSDVVMW